ncbi:MAG: alpha-amylase family glycosyl hydrolase [Lachnospiraceae bacterium]|nr:alpha-amylase family glycosyl hydrolase [Lachnospiraceae bacterium]
MLSTWKDSIFSDGSRRFVSNPSPSPEENVTVRLRFRQDSPIRRVMVKLYINGEQRIFPAVPSPADSVFAALEEKEAGFVSHEFSFTMSQYRLQYCFLLEAEDRIYYFNQAGLSDMSPDLKHDFVLLADYHQPEWVKSAVFYQIFPDRFCNGDPSLTVKDGEYKVNGYDTIEIRDWNTPAGTYDQVHCADFYGGDLIGIREKIPYLKELGITALYLNPIFAAPSVHKYDCIDYLHVDPHLGGDEALAALTQALHENGMKLILDISINHTGTAHRWFNMDKLYFDESVGAYHNPDAPERAYYMFDENNNYECWDNVPELPKLDFHSEALKDALYRSEDSVLKKWLKPPYSIDGWRFDVADVMANFGFSQLADQVWPEICAHIRQVNPDAYILAEHWDDCTNRLQGDSWDAPMNYYGFGRIIRQFYGAPDPFTERDPSVWPLTAHLTGDQFRQRVESYLSVLPFPMWQNQFNLFDSHDIGRFTSYPGITPEKMKGAVLAQFTLIGTPSVYYGDEANIDGAIGFFEGARYPMPWDSGFEASEIFKLHQTLAYLRVQYPALTDGSLRFLHTDAATLSFARFDENDLFVTVLNASAAEQTLTLPLRSVCAAEDLELTLEPMGCRLLHWSLPKPETFETMIR